MEQTTKNSANFSKKKILQTKCTRCSENFTPKVRVLLITHDGYPMSYVICNQCVQEGDILVDSMQPLSSESPMENKPILTEGGELPRGNYLRLCREEKTRDWFVLVDTQTKKYPEIVNGQVIDYLYDNIENIRFITPHSAGGKPADILEMVDLSVGVKSDTLAFESIFEKDKIWKRIFGSTNEKHAWL